MKRVLVTGGAGFVGSNLVRHLLSDSTEIVEIINLDKLTYAGNTEKLGDALRDRRHVFVHGDICCEDTLSRLFSAYDITAIIHLAAETHVDRSIADPQTFLHTNVLGTHTLLQSAYSFWCNSGRPQDFRMLYVSTDEVYGPNHGQEPFSESQPLRPTNPYAVSKAAGEMMAMSYFHTYGLPVVSVRCSNIYGPQQNGEKLIAKLIANAARGLPLPLYGDGMQVRQWLYVEDCCRALDLVLARGLVGETYNIGGPDLLPNREVALQVIAAVGELWSEAAECPAHPGLIVNVSDRPGHDRKYWIDSGRLRGLGYTPATAFSEGLRKTVRSTMCAGGPRHE